MENNLIIASPNRERILSWKQRLNGFVKTFVITDTLDILWDDVVRIKPQLLLLDIDLLKLNGLVGDVDLKRLCTEARVVVLSGAISEDMEWNLLKAGVRGCCRSDVKPDLLNQVVMAVNRGELWIRRSLTCRLIDELGKMTSKNNVNRASPSSLNKLTQREYDIAVHVGQGECNKQIAQSCSITERTVKSHLTEIYLKLGVTDRLNLALIISADDRHQRRGESQSK